MGEGVPAAALDLAAPVLNRADDMVIDLSFAQEEDVNVSAIVRGLLDSLKGTVDLSTHDVALTPTAKEVTATRRRYTLADDDTLTFAFDLAAVGRPLQHHLSASLRRTQ